MNEHGKNNQTNLRGTLLGVDTGRINGGHPALTKRTHKKKGVFRILRRLLHCIIDPCAMTQQFFCLGDSRLQAKNNSSAPSRDALSKAAHEAHRAVAGPHQPDSSAVVLRVPEVPPSTLRALDNIQVLLRVLERSCPAQNSTSHPCGGVYGQPRTRSKRKALWELSAEEPGPAGTKAEVAASQAPRPARKRQSVFLGSKHSSSAPLREHDHADIHTVASLKSRRRGDRGGLSLRFDNWELPQHRRRQSSHYAPSPSCKPTFNDVVADRFLFSSKAATAATIPPIK